MGRTAGTSPYYSAWISSTEQTLKEMVDACAAGDVKRIGELTELHALRMHAVIQSCDPPIRYLSATGPWRSSTTSRGCGPSRIEAAMRRPTPGPTSSCSSTPAECLRTPPPSSGRPASWGPAPASMLISRPESA